jgi:hypothetical protein
MPIEVIRDEDTDGASDTMMSPILRVPRAMWPTVFAYRAVWRAAVACARASSTPPTEAQVAELSLHLAEHDRLRQVLENTGVDARLVWLTLCEESDVLGRLAIMATWGERHAAGLGGRPS